MVRSKQRAFPFVETLTIEGLSAAGGSLWDELFKAGSTIRSVTCLELTFSGLEAPAAGSARIDGFLVGESSKSINLKRVRDDFSEAPFRLGNTASENEFHCRECNNWIRLPNSSLGILQEPDRHEQLTRLRLEHNDLHLAQELAKAQRKDLSPIRANSSSVSSLKTTVTSQDITYFFGKRNKRSQ